MRRLVVLLFMLAYTLAAAPVAGAYFSGVANPANPLAGHPWFVDSERSSWWVAMRTNPSIASSLSVEADNPMGKTFASFVTDPRTAVRDYILRAERSQPGSIPFLNLARIEGPSCPYRTSYPGFSETEVDNWVRGFAAGLGHHRVMVIVETDKLTGIRCLPGWAQARRYREFKFELHQMRVNDPNSIVYLDAGAGDWGKPPAMIARWLRKADVAEAQGFALNASHHDWTAKEVRFGLGVSKRLNNKHFVVNTNSNGWGPVPRPNAPGIQLWHKGCTPPGEGLGIQPTVQTPDPRVDAFVWSGTPGFENGTDCLGLGPRAGYTFYPQEAAMLAQNANPHP